MRDGWWPSDGRYANNMDKSFYQIADALNVDYKHT